MKNRPLVLSPSLGTALLLFGVLTVLLLPLFFGYVLLPTDHYDSLTLPFSHRFGPQHSSNPFVSDAILQFYPYKSFLREAWLDGRFAFWNPLILCGYPQYAETMATNFDVLNLLLLVFPMPVTFFIYSFSPLFIAGMAMWWLARDYGVRIGVARLAAVAFMLNGLFFTHLYPHFIPGSFCWIPLLLLFLRRYLHRRRSSDLVLAASFCAIAWLGGNVQTAAFVAIVVVCYAAAVEGDIRLKMRAWSAGAVLGLGFLLSFVMWAPTLELFYEVVRHGVVASTSLVHPYSVMQRVLTLPLLLTFLLPTLGTVPNGFSIYNVIGAYTIDFNASFGFVPILVACWGGWRYRLDRQLRPFLLLSIAALVLPLATPLYHYLYHRFFVVLIFAMVMIAALTIERVLALRDDRPGFQRFTVLATRIFYAVAAALIAVMASVTIFHASIEEHMRRYVLGHMAGTAFADGNAAWMTDRVRNTPDAFSLTSWTLWASLISIATAVYGLRMLFARERRSLALILIGTTAQLLVFAVNWLPISDATRYPLFPGSAAIDSLQSSRSRVFVDRHLHTGHQYLFLDNSNVVYGVAEVSGFESLLPRSFYVALNKYGYDTIPSLSLLSTLHVGRIVTGDWVSLHEPGLEQRTVEGLNIYTNHAVKPRVWLAARTRIATDSAVVALLLRGELDSNTVYLEDSIATVSDTASVVGNARIIRDEPETLAITTEASTACYLVLSDTYYPGWYATIDGTPSAIRRANYAMRAVAVPAGRHEVVMAFRPLSFRMGLYGSLLGLLVCTALLVFGRAKHRDTGDGDDRQPSRE